MGSRQFRYGIKQYGGLKFLCQPKSIVNAVGVKIDHPFKMYQGECPHLFKVPTSGPLPDLVEDPLIQAMKPGAGSGVFLFQGDIEIVEKLAPLYGPAHGAVHRLWAMPGSGRNFFNLCFTTNAVPLVLTGIEPMHFGLACQLAEFFTIAGRRLVLASSFRLPVMQSSTRITTELTSVPDPYELERIGNVLMTQYMLSNE